MEGLLNQWSIVNDFAYVAGVLFLTVLIRTVFAFLAAFKYATENGRLTVDNWNWWVSRIWIGFARKEGRYEPNFWYTALIGTAELAAYPVLMQTGSFTAIGAWIGLKTIAQWKVWQTDRSTFNLFLIGNILTLAGGYHLTRFVVTG